MIGAWMRALWFFFFLPSGSFSYFCVCSLVVRRGSLSGVDESRRSKILESFDDRYKQMRTCARGRLFRRFFNWIGRIKESEGWIGMEVQGE